MVSSKLFYSLFFSFSAGIFISKALPKSLEIFPFNTFFLILFVSFILFSVSFPEKRKYFFISSLIFLFFFLGFFRMAVVSREISQSEIAKLSQAKEKAVLLGEIVSEPKEGYGKESFFFKVKEIRGIKKKSKGKVLVFAKGNTLYHYGDLLEIRGALEEPPIFNDFNWRGYLLKEGVYAQMIYPQIVILGQKKDFYTIILSFKEKLRENIQKNFSPPQSFIFSSIILGDKKYLPSDLKNELNKTGLRHIVAVSGMHIVILEGILMNFLLGLGFWRKQALFFAIFFIFLFVAFTGFQVSAQRAALMGTILIFSQILGRPYAGLRALFFILFLMLLLNPFLLFFDVGFQLSFLATGGIIILSSFFRRYLSFLPEENFLNLRSILSMSFSAQVFTLPLLLYNFGYFSLVSPLTNILVLPFLPLLMALGFLFLSFSLLSPLLGKIISWFCWIILTYIVRIVKFFSAFSFVTFQIRISLLWVLFLYSFLGLTIFLLKKREKLFFLSG